jgi:hypothetical protein
VRSFVTACLVWLLIASSAQAAYIGSPIAFGVINQGGLPVGTAYPGQPIIPQINQNLPIFAPIPSPPPTGIVRGVATFTEAIGREMVVESDGVRPISIVPANASAAAGQSSLVVAMSPNPTLTCPYTAAINQTASTTVLTNTTGRSMHVCAVVIINGATAQSVTLAEGTGTTCATGVAYWLGGSGGTAALAANGGFSIPGTMVNYPMQHPGDNVCVLQSGSTNVSGSLTYGIY